MQPGPGGLVGTEPEDALQAELLKKRGVTIVEGQEITEHARCIKSADEIDLMRWTVRVCEAAMARMYERSEAGRTENEIWAELHYENIRSGGEWVETRLLAANVLERIIRHRNRFGSCIG